MIFDRAFVEQERAISAVKKTVVFDLDKTLMEYNDETQRFDLRTGIEEQLVNLHNKGIRLVLWTAALASRPKNFFKEHPQLLTLFDRIITLENSLPTTRRDREAISRIYGDDKASAASHFYGLMRPYHMKTKDISRSEERRVGKECRSRWSPY